MCVFFAVVSSQMEQFVVAIVYAFLIQDMLNRRVRLMAESESAAAAAVKAKPANKAKVRVCMRVCGGACATVVFSPAASVGTAVVVHY